jgi:hypothetical protein
MFEDRKTSNIDLDIAFLAAFHIGIRTPKQSTHQSSEIDKSTVPLVSPILVGCDG